MSEISISSLKLGQAAKEHEERKLKERKRNLMLLVKHYLYEEGYIETLRHFESEAKVPDNFVVCDNIDLSTILQEYESFYHIKFNRYLKICRRDSSNGMDNLSKTLKNINKFSQRNTNSEGAEKKKLSIKKNEECNKNSSKEMGGGDASMLLTAPLSITSYGSVSPREPPDDDDLHRIKLLKPISTYEGFCEEWKTYASLIAKEIIQEDLSVKWEEVIGLENAKSVLKEAIVYPIKYPDLFGNILEPWSGLLLYGPPGTGKTLLAKAVATECKTTFFNISASTIVSKWRGDSEKLVRVMFEMARHQAPSTVFLDELDSLASCRGNLSEHEASRRLKAELLTQLDGLRGTSGVFLLAASNMPWELDPAILRRLEKKILIDLPNLEARKEIIKHYLPKNILHQPKLETNLDYNELAQATEGYSGSDIRLISKETVMESMRHIFETLENRQINSTDLAFKAVNLKRIETGDVIRAIDKTRPGSTKFITKYREWKSEYDCA